MTVGLWGACWLVGMLVATPAPARGTARSATLSVKVDAAHPRGRLPADFLGLSFEAPTLASRAIASPSSRLPTLLRSLGVGVLRFAGDSVDHTQWRPSSGPTPPWAVASITPTDLRHLAALTSATGWRVLLGLNLGHLDPASAASEASFASSTLGPSLAGLEIGNEPDLYTRPVPTLFRSLGAKPLRPHRWGFASYLGEVSSVRQALANSGVSTPLYGPDTAHTTWVAPYARRVPGVSALTEHFYPADRCHQGRVVKHGISLATLLSRRVARHELRSVGGVISVGNRHRLPVRIDETNSVACGGQPNVSDTFASGLWAINLGLLSAARGAAGINFHGGLGPCQSRVTLQSLVYSPLCASPSGGLIARPEYYGLLFLHFLEGSSFVPIAYRTNHNISAYALLAPDGTLRVAIDDMDVASGTHAHLPVPPSTPPAIPIRVTLTLGPSYHQGNVMRLLAPGIGAKQRITLGGASIGPRGDLPGAKRTSLPRQRGRFVVTISPGSAALLTFKPQQSNAPH